MTRVLIALGSNVGDAEGNLVSGCRSLGQRLFEVVPSHIYKTEPMYEPDQPPFLNAAVAASTDMGPLSLFRMLKQIETTLGRVKRQTNGPREIDLDLIAYGAASYRFVEGKSEVLVVPHPRVAERRFVLQPLADVAPTAVIPGVGQVNDLLGKTNEQAANVVRLKDAVLPVRCAR